MAGARRRSGFTLIELLVVVAIIALLISILLPSLARARELSKRTVCAANLSGIGKGVYTYATGNGDDWPVAAHQEAVADGVGLVTYVNMIGRPPVGAAAESNITSTQLSTTRNMWVLAQSGASSAASFICPSSEDQKTDVDNPSVCWDFGGDQRGATACVNSQTSAWDEVSYGYQVPYGTKGRPNSDLDQRVALVADKGPFGAALEGTGATPAPTMSGKVDMNSTPDDWQPWNSPNHGGQGAGEGQNVLYTDSHAIFETKPTVGVGQDNIYTQWTHANPQPVDRALGNPPTGTQTPFGNEDSLIYP